MRVKRENHETVVLPAYAGMIPTTTNLGNAARSAPRVCGDDPHGTPHPRRPSQVLPAYAGMIRRRGAHTR